MTPLMDLIEKREPDRHEGSNEHSELLIAHQHLPIRKQVAAIERIFRHHRNDYKVFGFCDQTVQAILSCCMVRRTSGVLSCPNKHAGMKLYLPETT